MSLVTLPSTPALVGVRPFLLDTGTVLVPFLGGPAQRVNRMGMRFGVRASTIPLVSDGDGRLFVSRLLQARSDELLVDCPLVDVPWSSVGAPLIASAVTGGSLLPVKGLTAGATVKEGRFFSLIHGGRRYLHMLAADSTSNGSGNATFVIWPMLRTPLSTNDVIELDAPKMQGLVSAGEELNWEVALARRTSISFSVVERQ